MADSGSNPSKVPVMDQAEDNAFFPSPCSLNLCGSDKSDLEGTSHSNAYADGRLQVLVIVANERYLLMRNGTLFSTGTHPVEMFVPMYLLNKAGFRFDVATISGEPDKLKLWALSKADKEILDFYDRLKKQIKSPLKLSDVVADLGPDSNYAAAVRRSACRSART